MFISGFENENEITSTLIQTLFYLYIQPDCFMYKYGYIGQSYSYEN